MPKEKFNTVPAKLVAAFDASGKEASEVVVVAGFVSSQEDWRSFDVEWRARLPRTASITSTWLISPTSGNSLLRLERRRTTPPEAARGPVDIIKGHVYRQFASAIEMRTFSTLSEENKKEYALNAYVLAARSCAADLRIWQEKENFKPATAYVFEEGDEGKGKMIERFLGDNISLPLFKPKKDNEKPDGTVIRGYTPLQAANILSYELHKPHRDLLAGKPRITKFRWGLEQLSKIPGEPGYYSAENMAELNQRFNELTVTRAIAPEEAPDAP